MKMKGFFKFITIFIIVIVIYFSIILNIDHFIVSNNGKVEKYANPYYKYKDTESIFYKLGTFIETGQNISEKNIEVIKNSKIIKNILNNINHVEENQIDSYVEKLKEEDKIKLIENDIIYIATEDYGLAFSLDTNNIAYEMRIKYSSINRYWEAREIREEDKNEIYKKVEEELEKLGITEKFQFEPETIYIRYYNGIIADWDGEVYVIEDTTHHIKIEIELPSYEIISMQIGFEYFALRE